MLVDTMPITTLWGVATAESSQNPCFALFRWNGFGAVGTDDVIIDAFAVRACHDEIPKALVRPYCDTVDCTNVARSSPTDVQTSRL
jgi:hypothetical protein